MLSTWLFIILIGDAAQAIEVRGLQDCLELKQYLSTQVGNNEELKNKTAMGCFRNMGERSHDS